MIPVSLSLEPVAVFSKIEQHNVLESLKRGARGLNYEGKSGKEAHVSPQRAMFQRTRRVEHIFDDTAHNGTLLVQVEGVSIRTDDLNHINR